MADIKEETQHRWADIHQHFGIPLSALSGRHMPCPLCAQGKDCFRYTDHQGNGGYYCNKCGHGDGVDLLIAFTGNDFKTMVSEIRAMLGVTLATPKQNADVGKIRQRLWELWGAAVPIEKNCPVHKYLYGRGIRCEFGALTDIRYHQAVQYWGKDNDGKPKLEGNFPAMICMVRDDKGDPASVHVTYLADVPIRKKIMPPSKPWKGGAIRLTDHIDGGPMLLAEGVETALSALSHYPDFAAWACVSANNMEVFKPPGNCNMVQIIADNDESFTGLASAFELARLLSVKKKLNVSVVVPAVVGTDFNDLINSQSKDYYQFKTVEFKSK